MLISEKEAIEGARVLYPIGRIKAASAWHAVGYTPVSDNWRDRVLQDLIRRAEDVDAGPRNGGAEKGVPGAGGGARGRGGSRVRGGGLQG